IARLRLAQAPEGRRIFSRMTVLENLQMGATVAESANFDADLERVLALFLLDEPSLGLAPIIVRQIFDAIKTLNAETGLTVFLVEQNAYHALKLAHRGYVMVNGLITLAGTGRELLERPEIRQAYLEGGRH